MYVLALFILQNFKKVPELCHFQVQNGPSVLNNFFWYELLLLLSSNYLPFSLCKIQKNCYSRCRVMRMYHFSAQNGPFDPNKKFFGKLLISFSSTYQPFHCAPFKKKFFQGIQSCGIHNIWDQNEIFFRKPVNEPCFFHSCLSICQKSKSDINLLVKYW